MKARIAALLMGLLTMTAAATQAQPRRSGAEFMSPTLQSLQRDDTQNPAQLWVREGRSLWSRPAANGRSCAACHAGSSWRDAALRHPAFDGESARPITLEGRIDQCRQRHLQLAPQGPDGADVLALSAWFAHLGRGLPVAPPDDARLRAQRSGSLEFRWQGDNGFVHRESRPFNVT
jgi:sulfur-oxidizing protein SoxA